MDLMTPNCIYEVNGVTVKEKIIPNGTTWKDAVKAQKAGFSYGDKYKKELRLSDNTGKVQYVTIHTTNSVGTDEDAKQYTLATYNENMGSARVNFYVDNIGAWQNMKAGTGMSKNDPEGSAEVTWHAGDGSKSDGGNMTSLSIEIIMGSSLENDQKAVDNASRIAAWLLCKHNLGIDKLVTHTYWVNKSEGSVFHDADVQCTNIVYGKKWCPYYIFKSNDRRIALDNWKKFKSYVSNYLTLNISNNMATYNTGSSTKKDIEIGDLVKLSDDAVYYNGVVVPEWVKNQYWYVKSVTNDRVVINENKEHTHAICSPIHRKYVTIVEKELSNIEANPFSVYLVKIMTENLNIRSGAGIDYKCTGAITDQGVYTIVAEADGLGATKWGKLKSGAGWISLDYTQKV